MLCNKEGRRLKIEMRTPRDRIYSIKILVHRSVLVAKMIEQIWNLFGLGAFSVEIEIFISKMVYTDPLQPLYAQTPIHLASFGSK